jgi:hypothetical protein
VYFTHFFNGVGGKNLLFQSLKQPVVAESTPRGPLGFGKIQNAFLPTEFAGCCLTGYNFLIRSKEKYISFPTASGV